MPANGLLSGSVDSGTGLRVDRRCSGGGGLSIKNSSAESLRVETWSKIA